MIIPLFENFTMVTNTLVPSIVLNAIYTYERAFLREHTSVFFTTDN